MKVGVFLARMQPLHNAHLWLIDKALEENDKVLVVLGSENKVDMLRNPYNINLRKKMLRECYDIKANRKLKVITLPDWTMESDRDSDKIWGRYLYYNVVANIGQKRFSIYYSDDVAFLDSWFKDTEVYDYITYRTFERASMFEGLSATKIRNALITRDIDYVKQYCPPSVVARFDELASYYDDVRKNPREDFSME
ncbi:MAG: adenylyltransferase/cytidyltransferase family protein [Clostridia bacterium]|nr:adenylyltransferase/cytidyltransferase family protein [Clostridia bacterium]